MLKLYLNFGEDVNLIMKSCLHHENWGLSLTNGWPMIRPDKGSEHIVQSFICTSFLC